MKLGQHPGYGSIHIANVGGLPSTASITIASFDDDDDDNDDSSFDHNDDDNDEELQQELQQQQQQQEKQTECFSCFCRLLGFDSNPLASSSKQSNLINSAAADMRLAMLSNVSTAYNIVCISLALDMIGRLYPATSTELSWCSSALIAGMIVGQILGGMLGDILGRHVALMLVMMLQIIAAFFSALSRPITINCAFWWNNDDNNTSDDENNDTVIGIVMVLSVWRFILGLGCGGVYPLSAVMTAESQKSEKDTPKSVALTFSMQGFGYLMVPLCAVVLIRLLGPQSDLAWRLLLGFGCIPGIILTVMRVQRIAFQRHTKKQQQQTNNEGTKLLSEKNNGSENENMMDRNIRTAPVSVMHAISMEQNLIRKLLGTAGCWFLFDVLFYGNTLFQPLVLESAFGSAETLEKTVLDTLWIALIALPGYLVSVAAVGGRLSPRVIQLQGFVVMAVLYVTIGLAFDSLAHHEWLLVSLYGSTFFFSNFGPNATTFMLPTMTFSQPCRSTLNGFCAACGKAGALLGTIVFVPVAQRYDSGTVMLACAGISIVGAILTLACVPEILPSSSSVSSLLLSKSPKLSRAETKFLRSLSVEERQQVTLNVGKLPMKVVHSRPSLFDYVDSD